MANIATFYQPIHHVWIALNEVQVTYMTLQRHVLLMEWMLWYFSAGLQEDHEKRFSHPQEGNKLKFCCSNWKHYLGGRCFLNNKECFWTRVQYFKQHLCITTLTLQFWHFLQEHSSSNFDETQTNEYVIALFLGFRQVQLLFSWILIFSIHVSISEDYLESLAYMILSMEWISG